MHNNALTYLTAAFLIFMYYMGNTMVFLKSNKGLTLLY